MEAADGMQVRMIDSYSPNEVLLSGAAIGLYCLLRACAELRISKREKVSS